MNLNTIAFIFARGGSKGLPGKNIKMFFGKPLIAWSIEQAKKVKSIHRVIVSTDCKKIAKIAKKFGAEVPFLRPREISKDYSPEWMAWRHALSFLKETEGSMPEIMISIPATAPLRRVVDIENCLNLFKKGNVDTVVAITKSRRNPYFNIVKKKPSGYIDLVIRPKKKIYRRQDAPLVYDMTTLAFIADPKFILQNKSIFNGRVKAVEVPEDVSIDIDSLFDFKMAEFFFKNRGV